MISNKTKRVVRTKEVSMELSAADILELLRRAGHDVPASAASSGLRIYFAVPGGGDWSNTDIDIDEKHPLYVEWKISEVVRDA